MNDPFGSMKNMVGRFQQFMSNPMQFLMQNRMNVPQEYMNDPNGAIQYLMNSGQLTQQQYEWAKGTAKQIQNNPMFINMFNNQK